MEQPDRPTIRTFIDAGVLIDAHRAVEPIRSAALGILSDVNRTFLTSPFLYLETVPKAIWQHNHSEVAFYREFFESDLVVWCNDLTAILGLGKQEAERHGIGAMDALHVAAAKLAKADEFLTTERPHRAIHRTSIVNIRYAYSD